MLFPLVNKEETLNRREENETEERMKENPKTKIRWAVPDALPDAPSNCAEKTEHEKIFFNCFAAAFWKL